MNWSPSCWRSFCCLRCWRWRGCWRFHDKKTIIDIWRRIEEDAGAHRVGAGIVFKPDAKINGTGDIKLIEHTAGKVGDIERDDRRS